MTTRVAIADDHPLIREALSNLINRQPDMVLVGEAADGNEIVAIAKERHPDVILLDVEMPGLDGIGAIREILNHNPSMRVLMLTIHEDEEYADILMKAGATGYLGKATPGSNVVDAIRLVATGRIVLDTKIGRSLLRSVPPRQSGKAESDRGGSSSEFSQMQVQLLRWIAQGMTNAMIAKASGLSERTIKGYMTRLFNKLSVRSRAEALAVAIRLSIIHEDELADLQIRR